MKKMKFRNALRASLLCFFVIFMLCFPFFGVYLIEREIPSQYGDTYYGELSALYARLENTKGKKIVVLGNSSVAFGVDSALAEELLHAAGLDYSVCNFGLYGALGTKFMCELACNQIDEGDVVLFAPELEQQILSTYFSPEDAWYALDGDKSMCRAFSKETKKTLAAGYFSYAAKKYSLYQKGEKVEGSGVYTRSSFDERGDLKNYDRPYNVMPDGVDENNPVRFDPELFTDEFVDYINDYAAALEKKGARMYYSFAPMNAEAIAFDELEKKANFYSRLEDKLNFPVISDIGDYILEKEWFYDSNYHLNASGMTVRTVQLVNDLKTEFGNTTKTEYVLPDKPVIPDKEVEGEGDNSCAAMFEYRLDGSFYTVVGLTEEGKNAETLVLPYQVDGIYVKEFLPVVFFDDKNLKSVMIQENIRNLPDRSFLGCDNLREIVLKHTEPSDISVGYELLNGTSADCVIYVPFPGLSKFSNNYFWGKYAKRLQGYEI